MGRNHLSNAGAILCRRFERESKSGASKPDSSIKVTVAIHYKARMSAGASIKSGFKLARAV